MFENHEKGQWTIKDCRDFYSPKNFVGFSWLGICMSDWWETFCSSPDFERHHRRYRGKWQGRPKVAKTYYQMSIEIKWEPQGRPKFDQIRAKVHQRSQQFSDNGRSGEEVAPKIAEEFEINVSKLFKDLLRLPNIFFDWKKCGYSSKKKICNIAWSFYCNIDTNFCI